MAANVTKVSAKGVQRRRPPAAVSAAVLADMIGLTPRRLGQLAEEGMPKLTRGLYPLGGAVRWYLDFLRARHERQAAVAGPTHAEIARQIALLKLKQALSKVYDRREVLDTTFSAYTRLGVAFEELATRVGRELNLSADDLQIFRDMLDEMRARFVQDMGKYLEVDGVQPSRPQGDKKVVVLHLR